MKKLFQTLPKLPPSTTRYFSTLPLNKLTSISTVDGRYSNQVSILRPYFSEYGLIKARAKVELQWFKLIIQRKLISSTSHLSPQAMKFINQINENFSIQNAERVKEIQQTTKHDVKAIQYFLKQCFAQNSQLNELKQYLHFACTSQDINNLAQGIILSQANKNIIVPNLQKVQSAIQTRSKQYASYPMLARTHGQSATPTTMGKQFANFAYRVKRQLKSLKRHKPFGKFNGAVGNYNAHFVAYPLQDWLQISEQLVKERLKLQWNPYTTQIQPHDGLAAYSNNISLANTILLDFCRDMWGYISLGYFTQQTIKGEVGSSTMPHKVNPIYFENAEGNIGVANCLLNHFSTKLPVSRFQRDLSDSTVQRNIGYALGLCILSYSSILKAIERVEPNKGAMLEEVKMHYQLLAQPVQTVMRRYGLPNPYQALKEFTRGKQVTQGDYINFVKKLQGLPKDEKQKLLELTPEKYIGIAQILAKGPDMFESIQ